MLDRVREALPWAGGVFCLAVIVVLGWEWFHLWRRRR
jgi:hypothetical protein